MACVVHHAGPTDFAAQQHCGPAHVCTCARGSVVPWCVQELLSGALDSCELMYVGKRGGQLSIKQADINKLLVMSCKQVSHQQSTGCT